MNKRLNLIPARYRSAVIDFYKDCDGWWITINSEGPYHFSGYYAEYTIHEDTQKEAVEAFKEYITIKK